MAGHLTTVLEGSPAEGEAILLVWQVLSATSILMVCQEQLLPEVLLLTLLIAVLQTMEALAWEEMPAYMEALAKGVPVEVAGMEDPDRMLLPVAVDPAIPCMQLLAIQML